MRFKFCVMAVCLGIVGSAMAQSVPLFGEDLPNLGREAEPKDRIHLTPEELPDVSVFLDNTPSIQVQKQTQRRLEKVQGQKAIKRDPVLLREESRFSSQKSDEMIQQLNEGMSQYRAERVQKEASPDPATVPAEPKMPDSMAALFGSLSDVHAFEIAGVALGMTPEEVLEAATEHGYVVTKTEYGIPLHQTSFYEQRCRESGVRRVEEIQSCIVSQARHDEVHYLSSIILAKASTAEYMQVLFSTHATDNVAYKIFYENKGDNSLNFTRRNLAKKARRRDAFWNMVYDTYGYPDDKEMIIWGDPEKAYMKARMQGSNYNAYLILEDKEISDWDYEDAEKQKEALNFRHNFTFAEPKSSDEE